MSFFEDQELIKYEKPDYNWINITQKGFDVALSNQNYELTFRSNLATVIFTSIVSFAAIVTLVISNTEMWVKLVTTGFLALLCYEFWNTTTHL